MKYQLVIDGFVRHLIHLISRGHHFEGSTEFIWDFIQNQRDQPSVTVLRKGGFKDWPCEGSASHISKLGPCPSGTGTDDSGAGSLMVFD